MRSKKTVIVSLLLVLLMMMAQTEAGIYKLVDENGHVTYTNTPVKGGQRLYSGSTEIGVTAKAITKVPGMMTNFPKVTEGQQKKRDINRRQILENELATETKLLAEKQQALNETTRNLKQVATKDAQSLGDVNISQNENVRNIRHQITLHERNIMALRTELATH